MVGPAEEKIFQSCHGSAASTFEHAATYEDPCPAASQQKDHLHSCTVKKQSCTGALMLRSLQSSWLCRVRLTIDQKG